MKRRLVFPLVSIACALPIFGIAAYGAVFQPETLNPWAPGGGMFPNLWPLVLPQLLGSTGVIVNGVFAFRSALRGE